MHLGPGTRALVTGTSRGIGRAVAERLAARGATVGLAGRTTRELEALADALPGDHVVLGGVDVTSRAAIADAIERFGRIDLLAPAANVAHLGPFGDQPFEIAEEMTRVNWLGALQTVSAALPSLLAQRSGHIVVVSAEPAGHRPGAVHAALSSAVRVFAAHLRSELEGTGVSVTGVVAGDVPAHTIADRALRGVERDEPYVVVPRAGRLRGVVGRS